jgi:hypothetical protein
VLVVNRLFPSMASTEVNALLGFGAMAPVIIVATRGRLGYRGAEVAVLPVSATEVGAARSRDRP